MFLRRLFSLMLLVATSVSAQPYIAVNVTDGDTAKMLGVDKQQITCRLHGIDAPEKHQAFGSASKQSLAELIYRKTIDVQILDIDRYGRSICQMSVNGIDVNRDANRILTVGFLSC